jgi:predicted Zn-dependent peptidase
MLARPRTACAPTGEGQSAPRLRVCVKKTEQAQIALGIRTCSRHDRRRYALRLLNAILGENMSSRLFQEVREERGLAYSIYSSPSFFADTGDLVISVGLDPGKLGRTMRLILRELRRFSEDSVSVEELGRARDYALGQIDLGRESTESQMNWMGEQILGYGRVFTPSVVKRHLARVTAADIRTVARDFFRPERLSLAIVNPSKSSQTELESILRRGLPI